jgi:hypothetical protein
MPKCQPICNKSVKHYNLLQWILKEKLFTKVIQNAKQQALHWKILNLSIRGGGAQRFGSKREDLLIEVSECFVRPNICNWSELLHEL